MPPWWNGRHKGLKIPRGNPCRFDSDRRQITLTCWVIVRKKLIKHVAEDSRSEAEIPPYGGTTGGTKKNMSLDIKHIWWDVEGTLFQIPPEYEEAKNRRRFELYSGIIDKPLSEELRQEYREQYNKRKSHSAVFQALGKSKYFWQNELDQVDICSFVQRDKKTVTMFKNFAQLPYLHSVFTNRHLKYTKKILKHLGIPEARFTHFITNENFTHPKPHLEGFKLMVTLSNVAPSKILFIGDRIETDILPAKKVSLRTALVWSEKESTEADFTFSHVWDVISLFQ